MGTTRQVDVGSAAILVVIAVVVVGAASMSALADLGSTIRERARAQTAADAAALASVSGGRAVAADLAAANGGQLISWSPGPGIDTVTVVVRVGDSTATARATDAP